MKNVLTLLAKSVSLLIGLSAVMSAADAAIQKIIHAQQNEQFQMKKWKI